MLARMENPVTRHVWLLLAALFLPVACSALEPQEAPATITLVVATVTPQPTDTPAATVTPSPSATASPEPSETALPSATPARSGLIEAERSVNLRAGPGVSYAAMAALQPGDEVTLLAQDEDANWHQVQLADGRTGWVAASLVAAADAPAPAGDLPVIAVDSIRATATAIASEEGTPAAEEAAPAAEGPGEVAADGGRTGVDVLAYCDDGEHGFPAPTDLVAGSTIDVWWTWFASTRAQVDDHLANAIYRVTVDGEPLNDWQDYRLPPELHDDGNTYVYWYVRYGPLDAGEHRITYELTWQEAISDGYRRFGPGTSITQNTGSCTFRVLPAGSQG